MIFSKWIKNCNRLIENINNINCQAITCGHKTFGVKWLFEHLATHQLYTTVDTNAARSPKRFIPQDRWASLEEPQD